MRQSGIPNSIGTEFVLDVTDTYLSKEEIDDNKVLTRNEYGAGIQQGRSRTPA